MSTPLFHSCRTAVRHGMLALLCALLPLSPLRAATLYDDLGGAAGIEALTDRFLWNLADDTRINHFFVETNLPRFRDKLIEYLCWKSAGPCNYSGDDMRRTHANMGVDIDAFNATVENLIHAMEHLDISTGAQNRLLQILARDFEDVVQPAD